MNSKKSAINQEPFIGEDKMHIEGSAEELNTRIWSYLAATVFPVLLLAAGICFLMLERINDIAITENKIEGIEVIQGLKKSVTALQKIRGLWQIRLQGGEEGIFSQIEDRKIELDLALESLIGAQTSVRFDIQGQLMELRVDLQKLMARPVGTYRAKKLFEELSEQVNRLLGLMQLVAVRSSLILDPDKENYHLMELVVKRLPEVAEAIGRLRGVASGLIIKNPHTEEDRLLLQGYIVALEQELRNLLRNHTAAQNVLPNTEEYPELGIVNFINSSLFFSKGVTNLFKVTGTNEDAFKLFAEATKLIEENLILHNDAAIQLRALLQQRISSLYDRNTYSILLVILVSVLVWYFVTGFYQSNRQMLKQLVLDVARRKKAETELRKSEIRNKSILNAALDGVVIIDEGGRVVEFNPSAEKIFGYQNDAIQGRDLADLIIPKSLQDRHQKGLRRYCETGYQGALVGKRVELTARRANGEEFPVELTITPIQHEGESLITAFIRDISEHQKLQHQLQQSQRMEALGQLTGGIAHDFNNILTSILGYTELALGGLGKYDNEKINDYLSEVYNSGSRARDLVAQMLTFSRGGEGALKPLRLSPLIRESLKMLGSILPSSIEIKIQLDSDDMMVMSNPVQIHQLVMNLCINARDAMEGKGLLTIGLRHGKIMSVDCRSCLECVTGNYLQLFVRDTGAGIKPEQLSRIFEPFYSTKEVGKGTGMGLSTLHGIMHDHGGHIAVETELGKGSTFTLLFPEVASHITPKNAELTDKITVEQATYCGNILIVDDDVTVGGVIGELMKNHGYHTTVETDSRVALLKIVENPQAFDLVVTDQTMPGMTGVELARSMMSIRPELPVILCTGYSDKIDEDKVKAMGISGYLNKPIETDVLLKLAKQLILN